MLNWYKQAISSTPIIPSVLYHATPLKNIKSITKKGLGFSSEEEWLKHVLWDSFSSWDVVFLAEDPKNAIAFCRDYPNILGKIVVVSINTSMLETNKLKPDRNIAGGETELFGLWEYNGIIPPSAISIFQTVIKNDIHSLEN